MNPYEVELLRLNTRYKTNQKNPNWSEEDLNILNTAIADMYALSLSESTR